MHVERLAPALRPHLPGQVETRGPGMGQLRQACDRHAQAPASPNPYPADMAPGEAAQTSRELSDLARRAQADFAARVGDPAAELRVLQLRDAAVQLAEARKGEEGRLAGEAGELRKGYRKQVVKTAAWMGATLGALALGGVFPNPVTVVAVAATAIMCVRSINRSRDMQKNLAVQIPRLEEAMRTCRQVAAEASFAAPLLQGWNDLLQAPASAQAAA